MDLDLISWKARAGRARPDKNVLTEAEEEHQRKSKSAWAGRFIGRTEERYVW